MSGDGKFLGGAKGIVLTDTSKMALTLTIDHDGAADIQCSIPHAKAAAWLRMVANSIDTACPDCQGVGYWVNRHGPDDNVEQEPCETCGGTGEARREVAS